MHDDFKSYQKQLIHDDLVAFAGHSVHIAEGERDILASWNLRGYDHEAEFIISATEGVRVKINGSTLSYGAFLAGEHMADLPSVARMIQSNFSRHADDYFVPTRAFCPDSAGDTAVPATQCLSDLISGEAPDSTQVITVTGDAGCGKTRVLREFVRQKATDYASGTTDTLLLYVDAQGRALARLDEALATELQDLRVPLTYHCVPTLVRVGLLIPIIDGFDELLGVSRVESAFNSLSDFLNKLDGEGRVIASARSAYYEEEFVDRARQSSSSSRQGWSNVPVTIAKWSESDQNLWLAHKLRPKGITPEFRKQLKQAFTGQESLASKPLFFCRTVDLLHDGANLAGSETDLLRSLADAFLVREQKKKLLNTQGHPILSLPQLRELLGEVAQEMWVHETRELDRSTVRDVVDVFVSEMSGVTNKHREVVREKMPSSAFLTSGTERGNVSFEHEVFFSFFLVCSILGKGSPQKEDFRYLLSHSQISESIAERFASELRCLGFLSEGENLRRVVEQLNALVTSEPHEIVRKNAGAILLAVLSEFVLHGGEDGRKIHGLMFESVIFAGGELPEIAFANCTFSNVEFRQTDLSRTKFVECRANGLRLVEPRVRPGTTRLEFDGLDILTEVAGIVELSDDGRATSYDPRAIARILRKCGASVSDDGARVRPVNKELRSLLERFMRGYDRSNRLCEDDPRLRKVFSDPWWPTLRESLLEHDIVRQESPPTSGAPKIFYRSRVKPREVMAGINRTQPVDERIVALWDSLESVSG